ncbi:Phosphoenolpyruvate synthase [Arcticibacter svalbardensis MN12-7]|uniref:Phosphoenolpyruvate synthase n=1 Tax=Arcticibacter svalbardensis MN12-7 TaxID=1150600 RepID=R9GYR6_9SPHI
MIQKLSPLGIRVPGGFVITVEAYRQFLRHNKIEEKIEAILDVTNIENLEDLKSCGDQIRGLILQSKFPRDLSDLIAMAYTQLAETYKQSNVDVAVRSSATAEDLPDASFAGQQESYLNVSGPIALMEAVRCCFASLFTDRAISYRQRFGYDHFQIGLSVCVQKMVRSDLAASGVAFSLDTESGFKDVVVINGSFGLGEMIVQGAVSPDEFLLFKPTLKAGYSALIEKKLGVKDQKMIYSDVAAERVKIIKTTIEEQNSFCLSDAMAIQLSKWVVDIEDYYSALKNHWCPMDIEWAVDGISNELFIVQARPETIHSRKNQDVITECQMNDDARQEKIILKGIAVGDKIASGRVKVLSILEDSHSMDFMDGDVLVTEMTDPDWEPIMKKASAIITNKGGRTCHAAIVAREMGVPAILGCEHATELLHTGDIITASCAEGDIGIIYQGIINFTWQEIKISSLPKTKTPIMLNVASPELAFHFSNLPCSGIGLAREEFIINNYIKAHPLALLQHQILNDPILSTQINDLIKGFKNGEEYFINKLSYGIARIASAFYPNKVIVRFSDFKSNEYFNLLGGNHFEPKEENPMIGWRGASRYYSEKYKEAFILEIKAIIKVRQEMGLKNVVVMIPFCRTVDELMKVYQIMEAFGLKRGEDGLEVYLMAELPSNIILADEFAKHIDGFSIGSNDLTQLVLGIDRDSSLVAHLYDERNPAVKMMIKAVIKAARKAGIKVGICGQGPSDYPDFAQFLVEEGIDTISVTPDSFFKTVKAIHSIENKDRLVSVMPGKPQSPISTLSKIQMI